jgi:hypothetical protein
MKRSQDLRVLLAAALTNRRCRRRHFQLSTSPPTAAIPFLISAITALAVTGGPLAAVAHADDSANPPPSISGTPWVGSTLTLTQGMWGQPLTDPSDQWQACDASGGDCQAIPGETGATYVVSGAYVGDTIAVVETETAQDASVNQASTAPTDTVSYQPPDIQSGAMPAISGTAQAGQTLSESHGGWSPSPSSYSYQWEACDSVGANCSPISGATQETYTVALGQVGDTLQVQETAFDQTAPSRPIASASTSVVQTTSSVTLATSASSALVNQQVTLTATVTSSDPSGSPSGTVTFLNRSTPISGCDAPVAPSAQSVTATCDTSFSAQSAKLSAVFDPDSGSVVLGSTSPTVVVAVGKSSSATSIHAVKQVRAGNRITYTAQISVPGGRGAPATPSGKVEFLDGSKPISACVSRPLTKLVATCAISYTFAGKHAITARFLGDTNFKASASPAAHVTVTPIPIRGTIAARMQWTFFFTPTYSRVVAMLLTGVPYGSTVQMACHGHGCPFTTRRQLVPEPPQCPSNGRAACATTTVVDLGPSFATRHLAVGTQVTIMIARPEYVGKYYSFTVRARNVPSVNITCLAPDSTSPGVGCKLPVLTG